jgi:hypothetical protein
LPCNRSSYIFSVTNSFMISHKALPVAAIAE